jgi:hypothetical protein
MNLHPQCETLSLMATACAEISHHHHRLWLDRVTLKYWRPRLYCGVGGHSAPDTVHVAQCCVWSGACCRCSLDGLRGPLLKACNLTGVAAFHSCNTIYRLRISVFARADGNSYQHAINQLLQCCNITADFTPVSEGGKQAGNRRRTDR